MKQTRMRRFVLQRDEDATGTSGTGVVAEGVEFQCGRVALTWLSHYGCLSFYDNMRVVETLHGHEGRTKVKWVDPEWDAPPMVTYAVVHEPSKENIAVRGLRACRAWFDTMFPDAVQPELQFTERYKNEAAAWEAVVKACDKR